MSTLGELAATLREDGGLLAAVVAESGAPTPHGDAAGPDHALLVEAIREGYLLHYGDPRLVVDADPDLALLAGDYLYALGLARLAALGDLEGVAVLADLISLIARLHAEGRAAEAAGAWEAAVAELGHGREAARQSAS